MKYTTVIVYRPGMVHTGSNATKQAAEFGEGIITTSTRCCDSLLPNCMQFLISYVNDDPSTSWRQIDKSQTRRRQGCRCGEKNVSYQATNEKSHK